MSHASSLGDPTRVSVTLFANVVMNTVFTLPKTDNYLEYFT